MAKWPFQNKYFLFLDLVVLSRKRKKLQDFHFFYLLAISMKRKKVFFGSSSDVCVFVFSLAISEEREGRSQAAPKGPRLLVLYIAFPPDHSRWVKPECWLQDTAWGDVWTKYQVQSFLQGQLREVLFAKHSKHCSTALWLYWQGNFLSTYIHNVIKVKNSLWAHFISTTERCC